MQYIQKATKLHAFKHGMFKMHLLRTKAFVKNNLLLTVPYDSKTMY